MFLSVDPTSGFPVYRQIMDQVRRMVVGGRLAPGQKLPSIRELAATLQLNPLTVGKAYGELERDQVIEMRRGLGMFVRAARDPAPPRAADLGRGRATAPSPPPPGVGESARRFVLEAAQAGLVREEAQRLVASAWQELHGVDATRSGAPTISRRQRT